MAKRAKTAAAGVAVAENKVAAPAIPAAANKPQATATAGASIDDLMNAQGVTETAMPAKSKSDTPALPIPKSIVKELDKYIEQDKIEKAAKAQKTILGGDIRPAFEAERLQYCRTNKFFIKAATFGEKMTFILPKLDIIQANPKTGETINDRKKLAQEIFGMELYAKYFGDDNMFMVKSEVTTPVVVDGKPIASEQLQRLLRICNGQESGAPGLFRTFFDYIPMLKLQELGEVVLLEQDCALDPAIEAKVKMAVNQKLLSQTTGTLRGVGDEKDKKKK